MKVYTVRSFLMCDCTISAKSRWLLVEKSSNSYVNATACYIIMTQNDIDMKLSLSI